MVRRLELRHVRAWFPRRRFDAHKGDSGRIYIVAGSSGMAGAAILCSMGALRAGAGLVRVGIVKSQQRAVVRRGPVEVTTQSLPEGKDGCLSPKALVVISQALKKFQSHVCVLGPGIGQSFSVRRLVHKLVQSISIPLVLDADGLNAFADDDSALKRHRGPLVITPHEGELARLLKRSANWIHRHRAEAACLAANRYRCVCLLKGAGSLVTDGRVMWENPTGNPGMASAGMGDVLAGMIAAYAASVPLLRAACLGAYIHGRAADFAAKKISKIGFLASDVADFVPRAVMNI